MVVLNGNQLKQTEGGTLLKIKVLRKVSDAIEEPCLVPQITIQSKNIFK